MNTTKDRMQHIAHAHGVRRGRLDHEHGCRPRDGVPLTRAACRAIVLAEHRTRTRDRGNPYRRLPSDPGHWTTEARRVRYRRAIQSAFDQGYREARDRAPALQVLAGPGSAA
jgi:hypothetical protein